MGQSCPRFARTARFTGPSRETGLGHLLLHIRSRVPKHHHLSGLLAGLAELDARLGAGRGKPVGWVDVAAWSSRWLNANQRAPGSFREAQERPAYEGVGCPADWRKSWFGELGRFGFKYSAYRPVVPIV